MVKKSGQGVAHIRINLDLYYLFRICGCSTNNRSIIEYQAKLRFVLYSTLEKNFLQDV